MIVAILAAWIGYQQLVVARQPISAEQAPTKIDTVPVSEVDRLLSPNPASYAMVENGDNSKENIQFIYMPSLRILSNGHAIAKSVVVWNGSMVDEDVKYTEFIADYDCKGRTWINTYWQKYTKSGDPFETGPIVNWAAPLNPENKTTVLDFVCMSDAQRSQVAPVNRFWKYVQENGSPIDVADKIFSTFGHRRD